MKTKVENNATIIGNSISAKTSNTIAHIILPYNYEDNQDPVNPDRPDSPDKPDDKMKNIVYQE